MVMKLLIAYNLFVKNFLGVYFDLIGAIPHISHSILFLISLELLIVAWLVLKFIRNGW